MRHAPQERSSVAKVAENGEQDHLEMFGAIGLTRGLVQAAANMGRVNQLEGRIRKNRIWLLR